MSNNYSNKMTKLYFYTPEDKQVIVVMKNETIISFPSVVNATLKEVYLGEFVSYLDISSFEEKENRITFLQIPSNSHLKHIRLQHFHLKSIDLSSCKSLEEVNITNGQCEELILPENIKKVVCRENRIKELEISPEVEEVYCQGNQLEYLHIPREARLKKLICTGNHKLNSIYFSENLRNLKKVTCDNVELLGNIPEQCEVEMFTEASDPINWTPPAGMRRGEVER